MKHIILGSLMFLLIAPSQAEEMGKSGSDNACCTTCPLDNLTANCRASRNAEKRTAVPTKKGLPKGGGGKKNVKEV